MPSVVTSCRIWFLIVLASVDLKMLTTSLFFLYPRTLRNNQWGKWESIIVLVYQWLLNSSKSRGLPCNVVDWKNVSGLVTSLLQQNSSEPGEKMNMPKGRDLPWWTFCMTIRNRGKCESFTKNQAPGSYAISVYWEPIFYRYVFWERLSNGIKKRIR